MRILGKDNDFGDFDLPKTHPGCNRHHQDFFTIFRILRDPKLKNKQNHQGIYHERLHPGAREVDGPMDDVYGPKVPCDSSKLPKMRPKTSPDFLNGGFL